MRWMAWIGLVVLEGCSGAEEPPADAASQTPGESTPSQEAAFDRTPALAKADLADGLEDKVATQCAGCSLAMDGDPAHTIEVDGYSLHMCAGECKANFEADLDSNLKSLIQ